MGPKVTSGGRGKGGDGGKGSDNTGKDGDGAKKVERIKGPLVLKENSSVFKDVKELEREYKLIKCFTSGRNPLKVIVIK